MGSLQEASEVGQTTRKVAQLRTSTEHLLNDASQITAESRLPKALAC